jgi:hypothetical protein
MVSAGRRATASKWNVRPSSECGPPGHSNVRLDKDASPNKRLLHAGRCRARGRAHSGVTYATVLAVSLSPACHWQGRATYSSPLERKTL